ncbi:MAG: UDP-N-acetylglucosamine 2-epimerase (hydrolyzing) [Alphaproteobacteria bacterium]|nr:UDP-N-acetylglucosamine 2-epimerase (hydrolyzing) [Alphaproteobacteria bacterium]
MTRRVCIPLTTRGNYAKMKTAMAALAGRDDAVLQPVVGGPLLDPAYGDYGSLLERDGFTVADRIDYLDAATDLAGMTRSAGACLLAMQEAIGRLEPDWVVIVADRYEALALAQAALCMNVRIAHLEGGEVSGSIDERIRHAITKLAHLHLPANAEAAARIARMGEAEGAIVTVGTPSLDLISALDLADTSGTEAFVRDKGIGADIDIARPFLLVSFHPVVTEYGAARKQYEQLANVVHSVGLPTVWILPNLDAGAGVATDIVDALIGDAGAPPVVRLGSVPIEHYAVLLANTACLVGNTSSGLREGAFIGTPAVNIGNRQQGRTRGENVCDVGHETDAIQSAVEAQIGHGMYARNMLYGDGHSGRKIADALMTAWPPIDKTICY